MKYLQNEKLILNLIKFGPIILVLILSFFTTLIFVHQQNINLEKQISKSEEQFHTQNKQRVKEEVKRIINTLKNEKENFEKELKQSVKTRVYEAHDIATNIHKELIKNKPNHTKEELLQAIKVALGAIRFNKGRGYIFLFDTGGRNRLHPLNKKFEGLNILKFPDAKGYYFAKKMVNTIKSKSEDFDTYYWYKSKDRDKMYEKISFFKYFEPLNFGIGTGEYIVDYEKELQEKLLKEIKKITYSDNGYFFIQELKNDKTQEIETQKILEFIKKNKSGFISYDKIDKEDKKVQNPKKISYIEIFEPWDWVIGTGFYLDKLDKQLAKKEKELQIYNKKMIQQILYLSLAITTIFVFISFYTSKLVGNIFKEYSISVEKEIYKNEEQTKILLDAQKVAHIGNWQYDLKTNKATWAKEILNILGIEDENIDIGPEFLKSIMVKEDIPIFENSLKSCIKYGENHHCMYRVYRPDGEIRWIECRGIYHDDKKIVAGTAQDITENKLLELEKQQKDKLLEQQSKMATMGEMINNIAHQWKQPLSIIRTANSLISMSREDKDFASKEVVNNTIKQIDESINYLSTTIDDFRNFFKPDKKKTLFKISSPVNKTYTLMHSQFKENDIKLSINIEDIEFNGFENELLQVLINLLKNAKDELIEKNSEKIKLIHVDAFKQNNKILIKIKDNAGGVPIQIMDKIFNSYFTTKKDSEGTGIGLYMSKQIVENMKGSLRVENVEFDENKQIQKGAEFTITLPL